MRHTAIALALGLSCIVSTSQAETLQPITDPAQAPQTHAAIWQGYDPQAEPLDTEVLHEWEEDGVVLRVVRYRVGIFKGKKSMIAGVYGFPKGGSKLPGLVNIHGGGQYADHKAALTNAKRGYATISIAWAGRISAPNYRVSPKEVKLFWEGKTDDPHHKVTTDWAALDAYHAPSREGKDAFTTIRDGSEDWTLDSVKSPRNNSWFLCAMAARRALTFLERQPEVDGEKLGVYGHSMGGKLTVATAGSDSRVKAAAPSCGGVSDRFNDDPLHRNTVGDSPALKNIKCPTVFLKPANDFHGRINDLVTATQELGQTPWRVTCSPHLNHRDDPEYEVASQLWFDQHLKGSFTWANTPTVHLHLNRPSGTPEATVHVDTSQPIESVDFFYTQQGIGGGDRSLHNHHQNRFWHHATTTPRGANGHHANIPVSTTDKPLWLYANVTYRLPAPVSGAGYYYGDYTSDTYVVSSLIQLIHPDQLKGANVKPALHPTTMIETFAGDWKKQWYSHSTSQWEYRSHKVYHPLWQAPEGASLALEVRAPQASKLVIGLDKHAAEVTLAQPGAWQSIVLKPSDFTGVDGTALAAFKDLKELRLSPSETQRSKDKDGKSITRKLGGAWQGAEPEFRSLRWHTPVAVGAANLKPMMPQPKDFTSMWWRDGFPGKTENADWRRIIQTGNYWFMFDTDTMGIARLGAPLAGNTLPTGANLQLAMEIDGTTYRCKAGGSWSRWDGPRLIESGKFLQRADVTGLVFESDDGKKLNVEARFETAAWPDQLSMKLSARPGVKPIYAGEGTFGRAAGGGYGLGGKNQFVIPEADCATQQNFALDFWAYLPKDYQAGKAWPWLVCKNQHEQIEGNYGIQLRNEAVPEAIINIGGGRDNSHRQVAEKRHALRVDQWNHLSLSYDGQHLRLWVNGQKAIEKHIGKPFTPKAGTLTIGNRGDLGGGTDTFRYYGAIDQVRLYDQSLAANQVAHLVRHPAEGLPSLKPMREWAFDLNGQTAKQQPRETWTAAAIDVWLKKDDHEPLHARWENEKGKAWHDGETWQEASIRFDPTTFAPRPAASPISIAATEVATGEPREVTFDPAVGCHRIDLDNIIPIAPPGGENPSNDALERVRIDLKNSSATEQVAHLMFAKGWHGIKQKIGTPITGISAILRDADGQPTGIPVQLSKNWHFHREDASVHSGQWFHGISQVRLPAQSDLQLELVIAYGHWGGVAAASHAQLSLIGWGGNQRWDQSALGSWGESICYSPEQNEASCTITDVRPLMVTGMSDDPKRQKWNWTHNVGGGDFFRLFDPEGERYQRSGIVVDYRRQSPCLTEVMYSGGMRRAHIHHAQFVSLSRSDDLVCGTYRINMKVIDPVYFSRFAIFHIGSDNYAMTKERKVAVGNSKGLTAEWDARWGGDAYKGEPIEMVGPNPWASLHQSEGNGTDAPGAWATRGFIIREWKAVLGGKEVKHPWIAEYGRDRHAKLQTTLMEIVPPPGLKRLEPGDYIEATIEHIIAPQYAKDYYGPNTALQQLLAKHENSWQVIHHQAAGDELTVEAKVGNIVRSYPSVNVVTMNDRAELTLSGGVGYTALTFDGLSDYRGYRLLVDGVEVDQSVHGNDYWQTDYNAHTQRWAQTYNVRTVPGKVHQVVFEKR